MYTETSKRKQGSPCKNSPPTCFKMTNFNLFHCEGIEASPFSKLLKYEIDKFYRDVSTYKAVPLYNI